MCSTLCLAVQVMFYTGPICYDNCGRVLQMGGTLTPGAPPASSCTNTPPSFAYSCQQQVSSTHSAQHWAQLHHVSPPDCLVAPRPHVYLEWASTCGRLHHDWHRSQGDALSSQRVHRGTTDGN